MLSRRTRLLAPLFVACSFLAVGAAWTSWSSVLAEEPKFGAMLNETPLVAMVARGEPLAVMPRVSLAEVWAAGEHCSVERFGSAASSALLAPLCDEELHSAPIPMPPVPHWSEQVTACPTTPNDRAGRFDFLNPQRGRRATLLDPAVSDERSAELSHRSNGDTRSPWSTEIGSPTMRIALPSEMAMEPLSISSMPGRPVAPSGTMYLWSTTTEARATLGNTSAGFVLTRPPGAYSIDWVGIAVTAPIQWR